MCCVFQQYVLVMMRINIAVWLAYIAVYNDAFSIVINASKLLCAITLVVMLRLMCCYPPHHVCVYDCCYCIAINACAVMLM
jgi:hypothetical protein